MTPPTISLDELPDDVIRKIASHFDSVKQIIRFKNSSPLFKRNTQLFQPQDFQDLRMHRVATPELFVQVSNELDRIMYGGGSGDNNRDKRHDNVEMYSRMMYTFLRSCHELEGMTRWDFRYVRHLEFYGMMDMDTSISKLGSFDCLRDLHILKIAYCKFTDVSSLGDNESLFNLRELYLSNCRSDNAVLDISRLGNNNNLPNLELLSINSCPNIVDVSGLDLPNLENLEIFACHSIRDVSNLGPMPKLSQLRITECHGIESISELGSNNRLPNLTALDLDSCFNIRSVSDLGNLRNLYRLAVYFCVELIHMSELNLPNLRILLVHECKRFRFLDTLGKLPNLDILNFSDCNEIRSISPGLDKINDNFPNLHTLDLRSCSNLEKISALSSNSLQELVLIKCESITDISELGINNKLPNLHTVDLRMSYLDDEPKKEYLPNLRLVEH